MYTFKTGWMRSNRDAKQTANMLVCRQSRAGLYMVMREEQRRYNRGLVHRKCQTLNKNKAAGRAPITNTPNQCQTHSPGKAERSGRGGLEGTGEDKFISWKTILHLKVSTTAGTSVPPLCPHLPLLLCLCTVQPQLP